jgi:ketosteroid isomerase-like protein
MSNVRYVLAAALIAISQPIGAVEEAGGNAVHSRFHEGRMSEKAAEVWKVIEEWNAAFASNDVEKYFTFIDESITVLTASNPYRVEGKADDRAEFEYGLKKGYSRVGYFEEVAPLVQVYGDVAIATYFNRGHYGPEGQGQMIYLKETNVLRRENGRWRVIHIHVSK